MSVEQIKEDIEQAEMVFIGIGESFQVTLEQLEKNDLFIKKRNELMEIDEGEWFYPFLIKYFLQPQFHQDKIEIYRKIMHLIKNKNAYMVSLTSDDLLLKTRNREFSDVNIVFPCGGYEKLQCAKDCGEPVIEVPNFLWEEICLWIEDKEKIENIKKISCKSCDSDLIFNQVGQIKYDESCYLPQWERYKKWLEGTVNRKLIIIELGVGIAFPSVIRWPMEKVCLYNKKSKFYRINSDLYQLPENMENRAVSVKMNALYFVKINF